MKEAQELVGRFYLFRGWLGGWRLVHRLANLGEIRGSGRGQRPLACTHGIIQRTAAWGCIFLIGSYTIYSCLVLLINKAAISYDVGERFHKRKGKL